jgi:hypothetical protein
MKVPNTYYVHNAKDWNEFMQSFMHSWLIQLLDMAIVYILVCHFIKEVCTKLGMILEKIEVIKKPRKIQAILNIEISLWKSDFITFLQTFSDFMVSLEYANFWPNIFLFKTQTAYRAVARGGLGGL